MVVVGSLKLQEKDRPRLYLGIEVYWKEPWENKVSHQFHNHPADVSKARTSALIWILTLPLTSCVTLGKLLKLLVCKFLYLYIVDFKK